MSVSEGAGLKSSQALVIGAGFLGTHITAGLLAAGLQVTLLTRRPPAGGAAARVSGARLIIGDALDASTVQGTVDGVGTVVYCVNGFLPAESELDPLADLKLSMPPLLTVLDAMRTQAGAKLVYLSSGGTVYGEPRILPVPEWHPLMPANAYGLLKVVAESYVGFYRRQYGVASVVLRCGNVYGEDQPPNRSQGVVANLVSSAMTGEPFRLFGDGSVVRDYVYAGDVARVVAGLAASCDPPAVLNVGSGIGTSLGELVRVVSTVVRTVRVERQPARPCDVTRSVLDISALRAFMPFDPVELPTGLRRVAAAMASTALLLE